MVFTHKEAICSNLYNVPHIFQLTQALRKQGIMEAVPSVAIRLPPFGVTLICSPSTFGIWAMSKFDHPRYRQHPRYRVG